MDFDDLGNKIANLTMYDLRSAWTQAKNYALNISEIEAKVNEATSDEAWGASSTLMQEIAAATHNFADFNEIMPLIFRNFMEREAREWRPIYKSLQLLEYLIKNGSERVVDDARSHLGTIKILRNFHYIDEAGKDQGLNVRNRAKELSELLSDVDRIRQERRKARSNRQKYQGAGNGDFVPGSGGGRYGGFGSDSYYAGGFSAGAGAGSSYPGGSGGGGGGARESFDEYDAGDDDASAPPPRSGGGRTASSSRAQAASKAKPEAKVADLFSFDDEEPAPSAAPAANGVDAFGDDFDDFQSAPSGSSAAKGPPTPSKTASAAKPTPATKSTAGGDVFDFLGGDDSNVAANAAKSPPPTGASKSVTSSILSPTSSQPSRSASSSISSSALQPSRPNMATNNSSASTATKASTTSSAASGGLSGFDDLWAASSGSSANKSASNGKKTMADLAKERSGAGVWGTPQQQQQQRQQQGGAGKKDLFDLL